MRYKKLLERYPLISEQMDRGEIAVLLAEFEQWLHSEQSGGVVEFGCYTGTSSLFLRRLLDVYGSSREFHVYDSFAGLPEKTIHDLSPTGEQFKAGELAVSKKDFALQFKKASLRPPIIHKAWFEELTGDDVPGEIGFAFLDGDYYESIMQPLQLISARFAHGAVLVIDDYGNQALPGARRAVDEWRQANANRIASFREHSSLAILHLT